MTTRTRRTPAAHATLRWRRAAGRRAYIGVTALALMLLLAATSLAIFTTITAAVSATRESRDFVRTLKNLDTAEASATYALNKQPLLSTADGTGHGHNAELNRPSTWQWTKATNPFYGQIGGGQILMRAQVDDTVQRRDRAWRYRLVGSRSGTVDNPIYGIAAPSAWTSLVSSVDDSWIDGRVDGDWHLYGDGTLTIRNNSPITRVLSYDDGSTYTGGNAEFLRSTLSARLDEHLLSERVNACGTTLTRYRSSLNGGQIQAGQLRCYYQVIIDAPTTVVGAGTATVVSYGDIVIEDNLTTSAGNQLHLYTPSGTVKFRSAAQSVSAFLYAPNALCKTWHAQTVAYTGSLVCRQVQMNATFTYPPSLPTLEPAGTANDGAPDHSVSYLENPGYRDRFGN